MWRVPREFRLISWLIAESGMRHQRLVLMPGRVCGPRIWLRGGGLVPILQNRRCAHAAAVAIATLMSSHWLWVAWRHCARGL